MARTWGLSRVLQFLAQFTITHNEKAKIAHVVQRVCHSQEPVDPLDWHKPGDKGHDACLLRNPQLRSQCLAHLSSNLTIHREVREIQAQRNDLELRTRRDADRHKL